MGSSSSKAARSAAGSAVRKYPSRLPVHPQPSSRTTSAPPRPAETPGPGAHPISQASSSKSEAIDLDGRDPQFADRLSKLGPVKPAPTFSPSSTTIPPPSSTPQNRNQNQTARYPSSAASPAVAVVAARQRIQAAADQERIDAGRKGFPGKQYLDITTVKKALVMRDERGMNAGEIEEALGLRKGVVARLGQVGVVEVA